MRRPGGSAIIIMGRISLPDMATMEADWKSVRRMRMRWKTTMPASPIRAPTPQELIDETDYPSFDIEAANQAFYEWKKHKKKGIMNFRDHGYVSPMTGTKAPAHHTHWVDALDDSLERLPSENLNNTRGQPVENEL